ncbi:MAG: hypothetical protein WCC26_19120 [Terracidiphilus sp.]
MNRLALGALLAVILAPLCGCSSYWIDATIENHTGAAIVLLEVDYPSASFGANALAAGAAYHYRFKVLGSGVVKVQYTDTTTHQLRQANGPELSENQQGSLEIVLLPVGKAEFHLALAPAK